jgi:hypothetical protein
MAKISAYPNGNPPVDSDEFIVARAGDNRKLTWANVKAAISALYVSVTNANWVDLTDGGSTTLHTHAGGGGDGWTADANTWAFVSTDDPTGVLTVNADVTALIGFGDRIKFTNGGNVIYGKVSKAPTYAAPNTTITFLHQIDPTDSLALVLMANSAITLPSYSHVLNPFGFPASPLSWSVKITDTTNRSQATPTQHKWYNLGSLSITIPIGLWSVYYKIFINNYIAAAAVSAQHVSLSTNVPANAGDAESDADFTTQLELAIGSSVYSVQGMSLTATKVISLAAKTVYYAISKTKATSVNNIDFSNAQVGLIIIATFAV